MFNRFKNILTSSSVQPLKSKYRDSATQLHRLLPTFKCERELDAYIQEHGREKVKRELHTVTSDGYIPISFLGVNSRVLAACQKLMNPAEGILPLHANANFSPDFDPYSDYDVNSYEQLYNAANHVINKTRSIITKSPYAPWVDPTSNEAQQMHDHEHAVMLALGDANPNTASYGLRFGELSEKMFCQGTSITFAYVGLHQFALKKELGQLEGAVYTEQESGYHLLVLNDIHNPHNAIFCCPWQGIVIPTNQADEQLRIPMMHKVKGFSETYMLHYNRDYHKLTPLHDPVNASSLAPSPIVFNPFSFFKRATLGVQGILDLNHLSQVDQTFRKMR